MAELIIDIPTVKMATDLRFWLHERIVRCRDCRHFESDYSDGAMFGETVCWSWDNGHDYPHFTSPDGFCYRGERKAVDG